MKKGEGGTMGVGKRGGGSPLENRGGGVPFTDSFHRPGDQSLTKNIYFPRQLNGYHMVSEVLPFFTINNYFNVICFYYSNTFYVFARIYFVNNLWLSI